MQHIYVPGGVGAGREEWLVMETEMEMERRILFSGDEVKER